MDEYDYRASRHAAPSPDVSPDSHARGRRREATLRMHYLLWVLGILLVLLALPPIVKKVQYANTYAKERARVDVATEGLAELKGALRLEGLSQASRLIAQKVGPSVVHIKTSRILDTGSGGDEWSFLFGVPKQYESRGEGSGTIVDPSGYIVTNNHVIDGATDILVVLADGRQVSGRVVGSDPLTDIAVLKINADDLIATGWGDSEELEPGDFVWAVGSPFGLDRTVTFGIVSAKGRRGVTGSPYQDFLQTDAAVNPGNSGGPLVNIDGEIIGINTAIVGRAYQGISFATPSAIAKEVYEKLRTEGKVARGWLGVALQPITEDLAKQLDVEPGSGVLVANVVNASPAKEAGIKPGDIITHWNEQPVSDPTMLSRLVAATPIGSKAEATVIRDSGEMKVEVTVAQRPEQLR